MASHEKDVAVVDLVEDGKAIWQGEDDVVTTENKEDLKRVGWAICRSIPLDKEVLKKGVQSRIRLGYRRK